MLNNKNGRGWKTTYKIVPWKGWPHWELVINEWVSAGWRVDTHKLDHGGDGGVTIFIKTEEFNTPLLDAYVANSEIYNVVNSTEMYILQQEPGNNAEKACRMICERIKQVCTRPLELP